MEIERTKGGRELFNARTQVLWAAKAAGIQAIDTIFATSPTWRGASGDRARQRLGYTGKCLVNPRQIEVVHEVFAPKRRSRLRAAGDRAIQRRGLLGTGVISLGGKMVDAPVVRGRRGCCGTATPHGMVDTLIDEEAIHGAQ